MQAFLKESINTTTSLEISGPSPPPPQSQPVVSSTTDSKQKRKVRDEPGHTPYQRRVRIVDSSFKAAEQQIEQRQKTINLKSLDVAGKSSDGSRHFRQTLPSEDSLGDLVDVHSTLNKLDKALNLSPASAKDKSVVSCNHSRLNSSSRLESSSSREDASSSWLEISSPIIMEEGSTLETNSSGQDTSGSKKEGDSTFRMDEIDGRLVVPRPPAPTSSPPPPPPLLPQPQHSPNARESLDSSWVDISESMVPSVDVSGLPPPPPPLPPQEPQPPSSEEPPLPPPPPQQPADNFQTSNIAVEELMTQLSSTKL